MEGINDVQLYMHLLKSYVKISLRNVLKHWPHYLINIMGMGLAMSFCFTIYLVWAYNIEFDDYYKDTDQVYSLYSRRMEEGRMKRYSLVPLELTASLPSDVAGIGIHSRFLMNRAENIRYGDDFFFENIGFVDSAFFDLFPMEMKYGTLHGFKSEASGIYLTEEVSEKIFGKEDPVGKTLDVIVNGVDPLTLTVSGVFKHIPLNTSFYFGGLAHFQDFRTLYETDDSDPRGWKDDQMTAFYFKPVDPSRIEAVEKQFSTYIARQNEAREDWKLTSFEIHPFQNDLFQSDINWSATNNKLNVSTLIIFLVLAALVLLIACFNLANTTMAMMGERTKEIGVRKVMGSKTKQVFIQFLLEMTFVNGVALAVGLAFSGIMASKFFSLWGVSFDYNDVNTFYISVFILCFLVFVSLIAGLFPALYSVRFQPIEIFRKRMKLKRTGMVTRIFSVLQFAMCTVLLIASYVFTHNAEFINTFKMGYDKDMILNIDAGDETEYTALRDAALQNAAVIACAGTQDVITGYAGPEMLLESDTGKTEISTKRVGEKFLETMGLTLKGGRFFNGDIESDFTEAAIINESFAKTYNIDNPVGKMLRTSEGKRYIIGVVNDVIDNVYAEGNTIFPLMYTLVKPAKFSMLAIKTNVQNRVATFDYMEAAWKKINPVKPFPGHYQDDDVMHDARSTNDSLKQIFVFLAILGGALSLTGIFSLSSLNVVHRVKEIGIRKVLGATVSEMIMLVNREFIIMTVVAALLGGALGYMMTNALLGIIYKFYTPVELYMLLVPSVAIIAVALITTTFAIFSAANSNPVNSLRYE